MLYQLYVVPDIFFLEEIQPGSSLLTGFPSPAHISICSSPVFTLIQAAMVCDRDFVALFPIELKHVTKENTTDLPMTSNGST